MKRIQYSQILDFSRSLLIGAGASAEASTAVAEALCETSLRGVDSHGLRLLPHYTRAVIKGRVKGHPQMKLERRFPTTGMLDADDGFGHHAGYRAIDEAIAMAAEYGSGSVSVYNSSHCGAMAVYARRAASRGFLAFAFTHADSLLLSYNGTRAFFGTNPICMAAPMSNEEPFCLDMAPSLISWNKLKMARKDGLTLHPGLAADANGDPTLNPNQATCLIPIGEYKGYALAAMGEVLCALMTGMAFGLDIPSMFVAPMERPRKLGQFYMVLNIEGFVGRNNFLERMKSFAEQVRAEPRKSNETVMLPGDPEKQTAKVRSREGIPLDDDLIKECEELAQQLRVVPPFS